ncbi:MAG: ScpA family protein [Alphaproteobacteria bacterium]
MSEQPLPQTETDESDDAAPLVLNSTFVVDLEGFEGPIDLLLSLARSQKVDITQLSILTLAEQYLTYIEEARRVRLEIAADYLVMAAWLAYLKSRLLLPEPEGEDEPTGEELAARLQFQLQRLQAMRDASEKLMARARLGLDVFQRGMPEGVTVLRKSQWQCEMYDLLRAYADQVQGAPVTPLAMTMPTAMTIDEALGRLRSIIGDMPDWASLEALLPSGLRSGFDRRSAVAATLGASLEMAKSGQLQIRQRQPFGPILIKAQTSDASD